MIDVRQQEKNIKTVVVHYKAIIEIRAIKVTATTNKNFLFLKF